MAIRLTNASPGDATSTICDVRVLDTAGFMNFHRTTKRKFCEKWYLSSIVRIIFAFDSVWSKESRELQTSVSAQVHNPGGSRRIKIRNEFIKGVRRFFNGLRNSCSCHAVLKPELDVELYDTTFQKIRCFCHSSSNYHSDTLRNRVSWELCF